MRSSIPRRATASRPPTALGPTARQHSCSAWPATQVEHYRCRTSTRCGPTPSAFTFAIGGPSATTSRSTMARGGVLPDAGPTRPRHRALRSHHQQGAALWHRRHTHRLRHQGRRRAICSARGRRLSHGGQVGLPRGLWPDQRSVLWDRDRSSELPDPDAAQCRITRRPDAGRDAGGGDSRDHRAASREWHHRHSGNYAWGGYPKDFKRGYIQSWNFTVQRELPWKFTGQIGYVGTHSTRQLGLRDINAGQVIGAGEDGRPLVVAYRPHGDYHFPAACRIRAVPTQCRRSCIGGSPTASA